MDDFNKIISGYYMEAKELLKEIEEAVLEVEQNPGDLEQINRLFRAVHTIKGSGAMFGFNEIADFTHHLETILGKARDGVLTITKELADLILKSVDYINLLLECHDTDERSHKQTGEQIIHDLNMLCFCNDSHGTIDNLQDNAEGKSNNRDKREQTYRIRFLPSRRIFLNGTDPALLLAELRGMGESEVIPYINKIPSLDQLDPEECYLSWDIIITTEVNLDAIRDVFIFVENECELYIDLIDEETDPVESIQLKKLGEILVDRNKLKRDEINGILKHQKRIGELLVESDLVDQNTIDSALIEQRHLMKLQDKRREEKALSTIRVASEKLDILVDLVGELVTVQARLSQLSSLQAIADLKSIAEEVERLTEELRDNAMSLRMMPIGSTFSKFKRLVRDLSSELGKDIELTTEGAETELDKTVIERLDDPLVHLIRNSIDHGIESPDVRISSGKPAIGRIHISAFHSGAYVVIEIKDDGAGLNREAIYKKAVEKGFLPENAQLPDKDIFNCIFAPGFSTAQKITNVSGRGVGMDVVKRSIEALRGTVEVQSEKNVGTSIIIKIPLTLVIVEGLLVDIAEKRFVLPLSVVEECVELSCEDVRKNNGRNMVNLRGELVPYIRLRKEFEIEGQPPKLEQVVVVGINGGRFGFVVDKVIGEHQTVIKNLGKIYRDVNGISGATILGDGGVALIIDIMKLVDTKDETDCRKFI